MTDPNTLDEQIDEIIAGIAGDVFDYADSDDGEADRDEAVYSATKSYAAKLKTLFTEYSKEVDRLARVSEVESMAVLAVDIEELLPLLSTRLNQLKRNKGEDNGYTYEQKN